MTCKDCIHYYVCVVIQNSADEEEDYFTEFGCEDFINKSDFVDVVRCRDCKWFYLNSDEHFCDRICGIVHAVQETDFCSYGARSENENL